MDELVKSKTTGVVYNPKNGIAILDPKQQKLYVKYNVPVFDMYTIPDRKNNNEDIMVVIFDRKKSYPYYLLWKDYELK